MTTTLHSLAERVEALTGADRSLDWEIHLRDGLDGVGMYGDHPAYTASLDAAVTLVPEGCTWWLDTTEGKNEALVCWSGPVRKEDYRYAATPALALCAASLKARATQEPTP